MSMLLCHECFTWVEPRDGHCPDCLARADFGVADPPLARLQTILGNVCVPLGEVHVHRQPLSSRGLLYATTNGLYFLPHLIDAPPGPGISAATDQLFLWSLAAVVWAPLSLFALFWDAKSEAVTYRPQYLAPEQAEAVPQSLMNHPGAFFVPSAMIQSISRRFGAWIVHRSHCTKVKFTPTSPRESFDEKMSQLIATPPWKHVVI